MGVAACEGGPLLRRRLATGKGLSGLTGLVLVSERARVQYSQSYPRLSNTGAGKYVQGKSGQGFELHKSFQRGKRGRH